MKKVYLNIFIIVAGFSLLGYLTGWVGFYFISGGVALLSFYPPLAKLISMGWMKLGMALGWVNTKILLTLFFVMVITPLAFFYRLLKRNRDFAVGSWKDAESGTNFEEPW